MSETVQANDGAMLPLSSLQQQLVYAGGFLSTITVFYQDNTYVQTFINDGVNIVYISNWINSAAPIGQTPMTTEAGEIMITEDGEIMLTE